METGKLAGWAVAITVVVILLGTLFAPVVSDQIESNETYDTEEETITSAMNANATISKNQVITITTSSTAVATMTVGSTDVAIPAANQNGLPLVIAPGLGIVLWQAAGDTPSSSVRVYSANSSVPYAENLQGTITLTPTSTGYSVKSTNSAEDGALEEPTEAIVYSPTGGDYVLSSKWGGQADYQIAGLSNFYAIADSPNFIYTESVWAGSPTTGSMPFGGYTKVDGYTDLYTVTWPDDPDLTEHSLVGFPYEMTAHKITATHEPAWSGIMGAVVVLMCIVPLMMAAWGLYARRNDRS